MLYGSNGHERFLIKKMQLFCDTFGGGFFMFYPTYNIIKRVTKHASTFASSSYCNNGYEWATGAMWGSGIGFAVLCAHDWYKLRKQLAQEDTGDTGKGLSAKCSSFNPSARNIWMVGVLEKFSYSPNTVKRMGRLPTLFAFVLLAITYLQVYMYTRHWEGGKRRDFVTLFMMWAEVHACVFYFMKILLRKQKTGRGGEDNEDEDEDEDEDDDDFFLGSV